MHLAQLGAFQIENALAAAAMALAAGVDLDTVADGLTDARRPSRWRMEVSERADGTAVINDAYNANPESMEAALAVAARHPRARRASHRSPCSARCSSSATDVVRRPPAASGTSRGAAEVDVLLTVGEMAAHMAAAAREQAEWHGEAIVTAGRDEAVAWLRQNVSAGDVVLVKASRGAALELVAEALLDQPTDDTPAEGSSTR